MTHPHTPLPGNSHTTFTIFPAVDLRGGRVVRLAQGDPDRQTVYGDDPLAAAERWRAQGAGWLHVVNLDGAFGAGSDANALALKAVLSAGLKVQFGGGLRDATSVRAALAAGVARVVLGTAAVERPALVDWALDMYGPERIAVGVDARDGRVRVRGWAEETGLTPADLGRRLRRQGVTWCIYTDVGRDGMEAGANLTATVELARETGLSLIASGGVASAVEIGEMRTAGLRGVIVGRALYEGRVALPELLSESAL